jgi:hypothetical protein
MALETRSKSSKVYYYRKSRIGGQVVSTYCGTGRQAEQCRLLDVQAMRERQAERLATADALKRISEPFAAFDQALDETEGQIRLLLDVALLTAGYHRHKGQWRKKRVVEADA